MKVVFKEAREVFKKVGVSLFLFLTLFGCLRDFVLIPLLGKVWSLVLKTTPEGFISESNAVASILKAPWIIPAGLLCIIAYALVGMWQISAAILGVGYTFQGKKARLRDLLLLSIGQLRKSIGTGNWMILVYTMILLPLSNCFQLNDLISSFIVPEYIADFIQANTFFSIVFALLILGIAYLTLRWFYLLPSYFLKNHSFQEAKRESLKLTKDRWLKDGIGILLYNLVEVVRLCILPLLLIQIPSVLAYLLTSGLDYSTSIYNTVVLTLGKEAIGSITATLVTISLMCYLVNAYRKRLGEQKLSDRFELPELKTEAEPDKLNIVSLQVICSLLSAVLITGGYLILVNGAQKNPNLILEIVGETSIIAHKGYSSKAPENTMPAFEAADKCKVADYIELDVWSTKDGIPVVIHNRNISDATGVDKDVTECTFEELSKLPAPYAMSKEKFPEARIPSLEEVLKTYSASTPILIEIKGFSEDRELSAKVVALMKKYGCEYTSLVQSGDYAALKAVKETDPDIRCGLILAIVTGNYFNLPYADFFSVEHTFVSQKTVSILHRFGKDIFAWTVNYSESAESLCFSGVDGLITDYPDDLGEYVSEKNAMIEDVLIRGILDTFGIRGDLDRSTFQSGDY